MHETEGAAFSSLSDAQPIDFLGGIRYNTHQNFCEGKVLLAGIKERKGK